MSLSIIATSNTFGGCSKAKILDNLLRKHLWKCYLLGKTFIKKTK